MATHIYTSFKPWQVLNFVYFCWPLTMCASMWRDVVKELVSFPTCDIVFFPCKAPCYLFLRILHSWVAANSKLRNLIGLMEEWHLQALENMKEVSSNRGSVILSSKIACGIYRSHFIKVFYFCNVSILFSYFLLLSMLALNSATIFKVKLIVNVVHIAMVVEVWKLCYNSRKKVGHPVCLVTELHGLDGSTSLACQPIPYKKTSE